MPACDVYPDWPDPLPDLPDEPGVLACRFRPDTTLTHVSDAYTQAFQRTREQLLGRPFLELVPPDQHPAIWIKLRSLTPQRPFQSYHHPVQHADGTTGVQLWTDRAIFTAQGELIGYESIGRDITSLENTRHALQEAHDRFHQFATAIQDVVWFLNWPGNCIEFVSPSFDKLYGRPHDEMYRDPNVWSRCIHPDDRARVDAAFRQIERQTFNQTYRVIHPDGSIRWVRDYGEPVRDDAGRIMRIIGIASDITEQMQDRTQLRENQQRFAALMDGSMDAIYLFSSVRDAAGAITDFEFIDVNPRAAESISRTRAQIVGQRLCELLPINRQKDYFEKFRKAVETREPFADEVHVDAADQGVQAAWLQRQVIPLGDGVAIVVRDITQRKRDELEIAHLYRQTQTILDAVPSFIFYKDAHNRILRVNRAAAESMGRPVGEIEGRNTEDFFPEHAAAYYKDDIEVIQSRESKLGYVEAYDVPGRGKRYIQTDKVPMFDDAGNATGVLAVATDITERRRAEIERNELELALQERRLIGHELHDGIGQQLTGLRMLIESARKQNAKGSGVAQHTFDELAEIISDATNEVRRLINGLLPERITPGELPAALRKLADALIQQHGLEVRLEIDADADALADVLTDEQADHLLMIAHEAAHNAAKHAQGTRLSIALARDDTGIALEVSDNGRGIPQTPQNTVGTGKGLTILRHRADIIDASLQVFPHHRGGTTVRCVKPLHGMVGKETTS